MSQHAMLTSKYPPSDNLYESQSCEGDISLMLCHGWSTGEIETFFEDDNGGDPVPGLDVLIDDIRAEYANLIPKASEDAQRLDTLRDALAERNLAFSFDEGLTQSDCAEEAAEQAENDGRSGYVYCTNQDVDRVIHTGELYFGFSSVEAAESLMEALRGVGMTPMWGGKPTERVACEGLVVELPLAD